MFSNRVQKRLRKAVGLWKQGCSWFLLKHTPWNTNTLKDKIAQINIDALHVGCGNVYLPGWLNIYYEINDVYGCLKKIAPEDNSIDFQSFRKLYNSLKGKKDKDAWILNYNLLKPWPLADRSVRYIAGSHFIEHLDINGGIVFLSEAFRVLKTGGGIRLSCPDLYLYARSYVENQREFFENPLIKEWCAYKNALTPGEIFIAKAYDSGGSHKWFYDFDSLKHILELTGFQDIRREKRLTGNIPDLANLEPAKRELETVYVEAFKIESR